MTWTREELDGRLGRATFEQRAVNVDRPAATIVHWGCGCAAHSANLAPPVLRWTPCDFHTLAFADATVHQP